MERVDYEARTPPGERDDFTREGGQGAHTNPTMSGFTFSKSPRFSGDPMPVRYRLSAAAGKKKPKKPSPFLPPTKMMKPTPLPAKTKPPAVLPRTKHAKDISGASTTLCLVTRGQATTQTAVPSTEPDMTSGPLEPPTDGLGPPPAQTQENVAREGLPERVIFEKVKRHRQMLEEIPSSKTLQTSALQNLV